MQPEPEGERDQTDSQLRSPWKGSGPAGGWWQRLSGSASALPRPGRRSQPLEMGRTEESMDGSPGFTNGTTDNSRKGNEGAGVSPGDGTDKEVLAGGHILRQVFLPSVCCPCGTRHLIPVSRCSEVLVLKSVTALGTGQAPGWVSGKRAGPKEAAEGPLALPASGIRVSM